MSMKKVIAIVSLIGFFSVIKFLFDVTPLISNPSTENIEKVIGRAVETFIDLVIPWWLPLLSMGIIGVIFFILIFIFAPDLIAA